MLVGTVGGYILGKQGGSATSVWHEEREQVSSYRYISPLLSCDGAELSNTTSGNLRELREQLQKFVDTQRRENSITRSAVYIRELHGGVWLGINERDEFTPGSLLKVPAVLSLYKYAEEKDPDVLTREFEFDGSSVGVSQQYPPSEPLVPGSIYSIHDMVARALRFSDNDAAVLIAQTIEQSYLLDTYRDLGFVAPEMGNDYRIRVKDYASFFRILYNASYINRAVSEEVLSLLAQSDFRRGLVAGLPTGTVIAHKFGERDLGDGTHQLHDCGIVYGENPYIICVLSQGTSFEALERFIASVAKITHGMLR